ncbi:VIT and VWA domain-containing protein [uncultured Methanoregula sp.]|uniref:VIT and vWA domain-containing protein n=1 Tax=uncultured Methanoregula sp. TaxID=1005933 RepID=UPI002AAC427F|nr:VIT and VWA domain-containing protein [uncultured Methanoregula sp.]
MIFNTRWFDNSRPDGIAVLEIHGRDPSCPGFVPLRRTSLTGSVSGPLADFTLTHTFRYSKEENPHVLEAVYRFPLPGDAAVTGIDVSFGDVTIHSVLKPRREAEADYRTAKAGKKAAVLVTRESPDVLTLRIAGILPDEDVMITTRYVQAGMPQKSGFSFRIPLTTAPRYVRGDERYSRHANGQPLAVLRDPGHRFSLSVSAGQAGLLESPTHTLARGPDGLFILAGIEVIPDRDCVLVWEPARHETRPACQVFSNGSEETHLLVLVSPPYESPVRYPREIIILVDHSGSMEGAKWEAADWAVEHFINGLTDQDVFNLCLFESSSYWFSRQPLPAREENKERAIRFLADKRSGGTELGVALEQALSQVRAAGLFSRNVIIITDGAVSDSARILRMADCESQRKDARRISLLCIDAAPNSNLVHQVAERGGGIAKFLSSSPQEEDITSALDEVLQLWDAPVVVGLTLAVNRDNLLVDRRKVKKAPDGKCHIDLGDLPSGRSTWVVVRAPPGPEPLHYELCGPGNSTFPVPVFACPAVSALFGARIVAELEYLVHADYPEKELLQQLAGLGYGPDRSGMSSPAAVYAENRMKDVRNTLQDLIIRESLRASVLSSETAFVAVRSEPGKPVEEEVIVPNALPDGWSESFVVTMPTGMKMSCRKSMAAGPGAAPVSGGGILEWIGGGGNAFIAQPDGTMKLEKRTVISGAGYDGTGNCRKPVPPSQAAITSFPVQQPAEYRLFAGTPVVMGDESVLFDSSRPCDAGKLPDSCVLKKLEIMVREQHLLRRTGIYLLLYVDDPVVPGIKIPLDDLLRHGGSRPLNIQRVRDELFRIVLVDPAGVLKKNSPVMEVIVR